MRGAARTRAKRRPDTKLQEESQDERAAMARGLARLRVMRLTQEARDSARSTLAAIRRAKPA